MKRTFPIFRQHDQTDCGPVCLKMITAFLGQFYTLENLRELCQVNKEGVSLYALREAAEQIGFETLSIKVPYTSTSEELPALLSVPIPCIAYWQGKHFLVVYKVSKKFVWVADPAKGKLKLKRKIFEQGWLSKDGQGTLLLLEPTAHFPKISEEKKERHGWGTLLTYFSAYRKPISFLIIGLLITSLIQLILPFLTQAIVDIGIEQRDINFIYLILLGQIMLFSSYIIASALQNWLLLQLGTRINVSMIAHYIVKLTRLPMRFFDQRHIGDLIQRISDHARIEDFLTHVGLTTLFSIFTFLAFSIVLFIYDLSIFLVFLTGIFLYLGWIFLFLKRRKTVDYEQFQHLSDHQNSLIEIIRGMPDIKLQGSEEQRQQKWIRIQTALFKTNLKLLSLNQFQEGGAYLINQLKDVTITVIAAQGVIRGKLTLGMLLSIQYIIGQLNSPLLRMVNFIQSAQDARISLERLAEVHNKKEELTNNESTPLNINHPVDIKLEDLQFSYYRADVPVLQNINLIIPAGKITAFVGQSGSGKTTLAKLILGFYKPDEGQIKIGNQPLKNISPGQWRKHCGAVLQNGFIFSDTIASNIAEGQILNMQKIHKALEVAHIDEFINTLPQGPNTLTGEKGIQLSQGQQQRLLIARAVYKNPSYLIFDEATNALDSISEQQIIQNLKKFFAGKTVIIIAHRLSTIRDADQIVVIKDGQIAEIGQHEALLNNHGHYAELVREQVTVNGER